MWPSVFELWKCRRGRRAAVAVIAPLIEGSRCRLNGIPETAWLDPYMVGFIVMLITLAAKREVDVLDSHALGLVQSEAWAEITGMKADLIGEEVLHLSTAGHKIFEAGCRNAVAFERALYESSIVSDRLEPWGETVEIGSHQERASRTPGPFVAQDIAELWADYFDSRVTSPYPEGTVP
jgi:hypothetical protein